MLDSECMMLDDQGVTDEWIVRVQGTEYGPANIETLREWKAEGRLLPVNEARRADVDLWTTAAEIPGLFSVPPAVAIAGALPRNRPCNFRVVALLEILTETVADLSKRFFSIPRPHAAGVAAVDMQSANNCVRETAAGLQCRCAFGSRRGLRVSDVYTVDCDVAGLHRGNPNSHG